MLHVGLEVCSIEDAIVLEVCTIEEAVLEVCTIKKAPMLVDHHSATVAKT